MRVHELVSVITVFDASRRATKPFRIRWHNRVYSVKEVASHWTEETKGTLFHIYSVVAGNTHFILYFDTKKLQWTLEEMTDIEASI